MAQTRSASCKRCGRAGLRWARNKAGTWYLCASMGADGPAMAWVAHVCGSHEAITVDTPEVERAVRRYDACHVSAQNAFHHEAVRVVQVANPGANHDDVRAATLALLSAPRERHARVCACGVDSPPLYGVDDIDTKECRDCLIARVVG